MIGARLSDLTGCEGDLINQQVCKCARGTHPEHPSAPIRTDNRPGLHDNQLVNQPTSDA